MKCIIDLTGLPLGLVNNFFVETGLLLSLEVREDQVIGVVAEITQTKNEKVSA